jgi:hypothetical protein
MHRLVLDYIQYPISHSTKPNPSSTNTDLPDRRSRSIVVLFGFGRDNEPRFDLEPVRISVALSLDVHEAVLVQFLHPLLRGHLLDALRPGGRSGLT